MTDVRWRWLRRCVATVSLAALALVPLSDVPDDPPEGGLRTVIAAPTADRTRTPWQITALGDSVTAGSNCDCTAFPALYAADLAAADDRTVAVTNGGQAGATSDDLLDELRDPSDPVGSAISASELVVVTIGANDFADQHDQVEAGDCGDPDDLQCARAGLAHLHDTLAAILAEITTLRRGRSTAVLVTGYWNVFEDGDTAVQAYPAAGISASRDLTVAVNNVEREVAANHRDIYVDLFRPFVGADGMSDPTGLLAADGDHPNAKGHQAIAAALLAAGVAPLPVG
ncbi:MAG: SGNH/GDSL hydrolase family protein [Propionibacteriaceae bacterium]